MVSILCRVAQKRRRWNIKGKDAGSFVSGLDYEALRDVAVIFITMYDPFGLGLGCIVYTISNRCEEVPGMPIAWRAIMAFMDIGRME